MATAALLLLAAAGLYLGLPTLIGGSDKAVEAIASAEAAALPQAAARILEPVAPQAEAATPQAVAPAVEAVIAGDTLAWPPGQQLERAGESAFQALLARYGIDYTPLGGLDPCRAVESFGLRCLSGSGDLPALRRINQPVILQLSGPAGPYAVALVSAEGDTGTFIVGGVERKVETSALAASWTGGYQLLWRPPPGYQGMFQEGHRGPVVAWLRDALAVALEKPRASGEPAIFDAALAALVREFQAREGLPVDGVVGPMTLIHLNLALDPRLARLVVGPGAEGGG
jgi:general secretion pathway protein A